MWMRNTKTAPTVVAIAASIVLLVSQASARPPGERRFEGRVANQIILRGAAGEIGEILRSYGLRRRARVQSDRTGETLILVEVHPSVDTRDLIEKLQSEYSSSRP